jgi:hypothetical protein
MQNRVGWRIDRRRRDGEISGMRCLALLRRVFATPAPASFAAATPCFAGNLVMDMARNCLGSGLGQTSSGNGGCAGKPITPDWAG